MMNVYVILLSIVMISCQHPANREQDFSESSESKDINSGSDHVSMVNDDVKINQGDREVSIDTERSVVKWTGTKLMGTGKHEGTVKFSSGILKFEGGLLRGGEFVVDMRSIYITDIPLSDPVPRENLTTHLNSDFETSVFPTSSFRITHVKAVDQDTYSITGELAIKEVSRSITITADELKEGKEYACSFTFDRFNWNIGEDGTWLEKKLVDAEIKVFVELYTE